MYIEIHVRERGKEYSDIYTVHNNVVDLFALNLASYTLVFFILILITCSLPLFVL